MKAKARARTRRGEGEKEREAGEREKRQEPEPEKERFGGQCCVCMIAFRPVSRILFECARVCVQYLNRVVDWTGRFICTASRTRDSKSPGRPCIHISPLQFPLPSRLSLFLFIVQQQTHLTRIWARTLLARLPMRAGRWHQAL